MSKTSYSVRLTEEQNLVLQRRMRNLGYQKAAPFLTDAALGHLGRDAADGDLGWRHDVLERLNDILAAQDDLTVRKKLLDVARRIERAVDAGGDPDAD
ncbi:MAG: hypothetical protein HLUCCA05_12695 [Roseibaca calidilacus]|uniref:Uncharacterized protein n=1 Tax=Roseibaca calidilacus TaxID=1666912 RepID=A0A0P7W9U7_9RHOB|nr:hypothetical protein [Roseibaca calidilacus]KPP94172.1 MAG: hypothetical protein HLUCCA05_12695 [Roseibaca calidilacus]